MANSCIISQKHWTEGKTIKTQDSKSHTCQTFFFSFWQWAVKSYHCADPKETKKAVGTIKKTTEIQYHFFSSWWVITFWVRVWINSLSLSVTKWDKEESCMHTQLIHDIQMNQILRNSGGMTLLQIYPLCLPCKSNQSLVWISLKLQSVVRMICRN